MYIVVQTALQSSLQHFHHPNVIVPAFTPSSHLQPLATANLLSISIDLPFVDISNKWTNKIYDLFVTYFIHTVSCFWGSSMISHINVHFQAKIHMRFVRGNNLYCSYLWVHTHFTSNFHLEWKGNPNELQRIPIFNIYPHTIWHFQINHLLHLLRKFALSF